ncbi:MAG: hypothetical protein DDG59_07525 [Anaerolineae bacterium]|jgi:hypothetical protein|nr:MAG: hypothetical protein DDG59_07525 [Anaerolineae bacterium]
MPCETGFLTTKSTILYGNRTIPKDGQTHRLVEKVLGCDLQSLDAFDAEQSSSRVMDELPAVEVFFEP